MQFTPSPRIVEETVLRYLGGCLPTPGTVASLVAKTIFAFVVAGFASITPITWATAPTNDVCSGATVIPGAGPFPHYTAPKDIAEATNTVTEPVPACQEFVDRSIWFMFTPVTNAIYTITTCADAGTATTVSDTVIAIYRSTGGCGGPLMMEDCNDDFCGLQSAVTRPLLANTTYYIVVWQYFDPLDPPSSAGLVQLSVTRFLRPPNDTCATALAVQLDAPETGSTLGAQNDYQLAPNGCFTGTGQTASTASGRDVVYSFQAPRDGDYSFKVSNYTGESNLVLYVAGSCPSNGTPATVTDCLGAANRSSRSTAEDVVCVALASNQQVFVFVDDHSLTTGSSFRFEVNRCSRESEPNNTPETAAHLSCGIVGGNTSGDVDFFHLGRPPEGSRVFALVNGAAANSTDFDLRITTATDTLEFDEADNDSAFGSFSPNIAGTPLPGAPVFLRVNFRAVSAEPYHIYTTVQPPAAAAVQETEPNGMVDVATQAPANYFRGALAEPAPSPDQDVFGFLAREGDLVFVSLDGDPLRDLTPIDARLELLDGSGNAILTVDNNNAISLGPPNVSSLAATAPASPGEGFVYRVVDEGVYYVRVSISPGATPEAGAGDYLLSITRNCFIGDTGENAPPTVTNLSAVGAFEGDVATLNGVVSDREPWQPHWVVITWGDGTSNTNYVAPPENAFSAQHTFSDDNPTGTASDVYAIQVQALDNWRSVGGGSTGLRVSNAPPVLAAAMATSPALTNEVVTLSATFSDASALDTFTLTINWGDGTPLLVTNFPAGPGSFTLSHTYDSVGFKDVVLALKDDDNGTANVTLPVAVHSGIGAAANLGSMTRAANGAISLQLHGTPGASYHVEYSSDLKTWTTTPIVIADQNGIIPFNDPGAANAPRRFYRAVSP